MSDKAHTVVVGLDGVPHSLLLDLQDKGCLPCISKISQTGLLGRMEVTIPEISSVSWTSFMTGEQSGAHGIFGFMDLEPGTYQLFFPNYLHLQSATIWDEFAAQGKRSVVINMPGTYPARTVQGVLISGFVAIDLNKAVYPLSLVPVLNRMQYRIDIDTARARSDHDFLFRDLSETLASRLQVVNTLWDDIDWDLFIVVVTGTDRLMHFLWDAYEDQAHIHHTRFLDYFRKVDEFVGAVYDRFTALSGFSQNANRFFMLSDHGFTKIKSEVYLNAWLRRNGFLNFKNAQPRTLDELGPGSQAFAMDPSRIYINMKERYPAGCVEKSDYEIVRRDLMQGLMCLRDADGEPVMKKVYTREELYHGAHTAKAPDLIALSNHGFDLKGKISGEDTFGKSNLTGMHTQDDAFFFSSDGSVCRTIFEAKKILLNEQ